MSNIDIRHAHSLSDENAHAAIAEVARKLQERFEVNTHWEGQTLRLARSGLEGAIEMLPGAVRVKAELGFLLSAMQGMVESEIRRVLAEKLG